jgi:hypothetical protein
MSLWAITSYFNPMRYQRRRANYAAFREHLDVPLVAVELAYGDFELTASDADVLIRLRGRDVMWQKERLLNVALHALPDSCRKVIWMDCDVIFEASDWSRHVSRLLDRFILVQAFSHADHLPPDWRADDTRTSILFTQPSVTSTITSATQVATLLGRPVIGSSDSTNNGLAWAARRELLGGTGFYDACIVGGGDLAMVSAVYWCFGRVLRTMNDRQKAHYLVWARRWHEAVSGGTGFLDCRVFHLWHGEMDNRRYRERHDGLRRYDFDPFDDIAHDENGTWRWNTHKPEMHEYVRSYFAARKEDG